METIFSQYIAVPDAAAGVTCNLATEREGATYSSSLARRASTASPAHHTNVCALSSVKSVLILEIRLFCKKVTIITGPVVQKDSLPKTKKPSNSPAGGVLGKLPLRQSKGTQKIKQKGLTGGSAARLLSYLLVRGHVVLDKHTNVF